MNFNGNYLHILALCCWKNCIERKFNIKKYFIDILRGQKKFLVRRGRRSSIKKGDDIEVAVSELKIFCQNSPQIGNIFIKLPSLFFSQSHHNIKAYPRVRRKKFPWYKKHIYIYTAAAPF